jgi:hypothetical protein
LSPIRPGGELTLGFHFISPLIRPAAFIAQRQYFALRVGFFCA